MAPPLVHADAGRGACSGSGSAPPRVAIPRSYAGRGFDLTTGHTSLFLSQGCDLRLVAYTLSNALSSNALTCVLRNPRGSGDLGSRPQRRQPEARGGITGVCEKNTPPDKKTGWKISFESTESGAGLQFLLLARMAKAHVKGLIFHRHRYDPIRLATICCRFCVSHHFPGLLLELLTAPEEPLRTRYWSAAASRGISSIALAEISKHDVSLSVHDVITY